MRDTIFFGAGHLIKENKDLNAKFIVDNNPDLIGTHYEGLPIFSPETINQLSEKYFVIVCATSISDIKAQLSSMGYEWHKDAKVTESLAESEAVVRIEEHRHKLLISSGLPSTAGSGAQGGIYLVEETNDFPKVDHIYQGNVHGLIMTHEGGMACSDQGSGIVELDSDYQIKHTTPLPKGLRPHGFKPYGNDWIVVCSTDDSLICVTREGNLKFKHRFSSRMDTEGSAQHHANDVEIIGDFAYVSMFSISGNWKRGVFDGGVLEVNLTTGATQPLINTLMMPHSISFFEDNLWILDSFRGQILGPNFQAIGQLPGFVRGLARVENYLIVGESKNRNFSRLLPNRSPVSLDSKLTIIDTQHNCCRSIPLPSAISEIHSITSA